MTDLNRVLLVYLPEIVVLGGLAGLLTLVLCWPGDDDAPHTTPENLRHYQRQEMSRGWDNHIRWTPRADGQPFWGRD